MKKRTIPYIFLLLATFFEVKAQDAQFTQFNATPLYVNPGYTGTTPQQRFTAITRIQWPNLENTFSSHVISYDLSLPNVNSGVGIYIYTDKAGDLGWRQTTANLSYSYIFTINDTWVIRPGLQFGYGVQQVGLGAFNPNGPGASTADDIFSSLSDSRGFFDFAGGVLIYNKSTWLGVSVYHLSEPNVALNDNNVQPLDRKINVHGGVKIPLYKGSFRKTRIPTLAPSFLYRKQGEFDQLDFGTNFEYNPVMIGLWYRGLPLFDGLLTNTSEDAISLLLGLRFKKLEVGYSYDFTVSSLGPSTGGAHEISAVYQFVYKTAPRPNRKPIACPSFSQSVQDQFKY